MPKVPIDYSRTQIYKYVCNDSSVLCEYVGSTTNWDKRKAQHKQFCNNETNPHYHLKLYEMMRANGGFDNWKMILIEDYPCKSKREACAREQYQLEQLTEKINNIRALRTEEQLKEYHTSYYQEHKEKIKEKATIYQQEHKDERKEYLKEYREKNLDKIKTHKNEKLVCECGVTCSRNNMTTHKKSKQHLTYIEGTP